MVWFVEPLVASAAVAVDHILGVVRSETALKATEKALDGGLPSADLSDNESVGT